MERYRNAGAIIAILVLIVVVIVVMGALLFGLSARYLEWVAIVLIGLLAITRLT